jgi:hypothetical protein
MLNHRRRVLLVLLLALLLSPGLSLAAGRGLRSPAAEESPFERLLTWVERTWDAWAGDVPAAAAETPTPQKVGCGIDPNGGCYGGVSLVTGGH